jgi:hypothetical protein
VGIYDVAGKEINLVAWSGSGPPIDPRSTSDPRPQMMTIVLDPAGALTGFLGAAKEGTDPLGVEDQQRLEGCVQILAPFWGWVVP